MKEIFIVLTHTGTILSSIIKYYTKTRYSHVSIALDSDLKKLYSFGRINPYNPYRGGFIHEGLNCGTFKRFRNTISAVYSLELTNEQYIKMQSIIEQMKKNKSKYKFNIIGLFLVSLDKKYRREDAFYCAEFVKYVLESGLDKKILPEVVKPMDFSNLKDINLVYEGLLKKYNYKHDLSKLNYKFSEYYKKDAIV